MSSTKSDIFTPLVASAKTITDESVDLGSQDSTLSEETEISPITQTSINDVDMTSPSTIGDADDDGLDMPSPSTIDDADDDDDGLACLDKIRSLLESGKSAKSKLAQIRDIINSTSGGKKKSRKVHKNHKKGKNSRKKQRKGSRK